MVGHQGNDFQITDAFWKKLNELTAEFDEPGRFVCLPGYEWSGNTGMGGDRNIFYRHEGRPIRRSSHILVEGQTSTDAIYTADKLFGALEGEDAVVIAHVGGRYADLKYAHDGTARARRRGAFDLGHVRMDSARRVREGLSRRRRLPQRRPQGPARRDAAGRLDLRRDRRAHLLLHAGADARRAVRRRCASASTTARPARASSSICSGAFDRDGDRLLRRSASSARRRSSPCARRGWATSSGPARVPMQLSAEVIGTAPVERVDVLHGTRGRAYGPAVTRAADLGRRVRVLWQGAEYRGRGRETIWQGKLTRRGQSHRALCPVNFLNPERKMTETAPGTALAWSSVTTGNLAGIDLWLDEAQTGTLKIETNVVSGEVDLATLADNVVAFDGGGLGRQAERLSPARGGLEPARHAGAFGDVSGRRRPAGVYPRDAGRRQPGLDQPDLSDRVVPIADLD